MARSNFMSDSSLKRARRVVQEGVIAGFLERSIREKTIRNVFGIKKFSKKFFTMESHSKNFFENFFLNGENQWGTLSRTGAPRKFFFRFYYRKTFFFHSKIFYRRTKPITFYRIVLEDSNHFRWIELVELHHTMQSRFVSNDPATRKPLGKKFGSKNNTFKVLGRGGVTVFCLSPRRVYERGWIWRRKTTKSAENFSFVPQIILTHLKKFFIAPFTL